MLVRSGCGWWGAYPFIGKLLGFMALSRSRRTLRYSKKPIFRFSYSQYLRLTVLIKHKKLFSTILQRKTPSKLSNFFQQKIQELNSQANIFLKLPNEIIKREKERKPQNGTKNIAKANTLFWDKLQFAKKYNWNDKFLIKKTRKFICYGNRNKE